MKIPPSIPAKGLGLRRELLNNLPELLQSQVEFLEIAPENWLGIGGKRAKKLAEFTQHYPIVCHGLSLSLGGVTPLNLPFIHELKTFLDTHNVIYYSEHLSFCDDTQGYLYDLLPIPFTEEAILHTAKRIKQAQEILERRIAIENISYYYSPLQVISEIDFINGVLTEADCDLLLDINNVYVNSFNHNYNAKDFLNSLPYERVAYIHIAGHDVYDETTLIDTHGTAVTDNVWELLAYTYKQYGKIPTLLERDNEIPAIAQLLTEINKIADLQQQATMEAV